MIVKMFNFLHKKLQISGKNNFLSVKNQRIKGRIVGSSNEIVFKNSNKNLKCKITIQGNNNRIYIDNILCSKSQGKLNISIIGDNNTISLKKNIIIVEELSVSILEGCYNGKITVDENTSFWRTHLQTCDNNSAILIGKNCMFSFGTRIFNTDGHSIFQNNKLINQAGKCVVSDCVWLGFESVVLKNSYIPEGCIIGYRSLVSDSKFSPHCVLAGVPAKVVKRNITWNRNTPNTSMMNTKTEWK